MNQKVFLFDHLKQTDKVASLQVQSIKILCDELNLNIVKSLSSGLSLTKVEEKSFLECMQCANLIFAHLPLQEINKVVGHKLSSRSDIYDKFPNNQIVILVTTVPSGYPEKSHLDKVLTIERNKRYILFVRKMDLLERNSEILKHVLNLSPDEAETIVFQGGASVFGYESSPFRVVSEILPALLILCQGYLIVYTSQDTLEPGIKNNSNIHTSFSKALSLMNFNEFSNNQSFLLQTLQTKDNRKLREQVSSSSWWRSVFDIQNESIINKVSSEWGPYRSESWSKIEELLKYIDGALHQEIPLNVVADAFCELKAKLCNT